MMKKNFFEKCLLLAVVLGIMAVLSACENPVQKIGDKIADIMEPMTPDKTYENKDVYAMSPKELEEHLKNGGYEAHLKAMKAEYEAEAEESAPPEEIPTGEEYFDEDTPWEKGVIYFDYQAWLKEHPEEDESSELLKIPEKYRKYIPASIKEGYCQSIILMDIMSLECSRSQLQEIIELMKADGIEFYQNSETDEYVNCQGGKESGLAVQIVWSEGTGTFMFTDVGAAAEMTGVPGLQ